MSIVTDSKEQLESSWRALQKKTPKKPTESSCIESVTHNINYIMLWRKILNISNVKMWGMGTASDTISHSLTPLHDDVI